MELVPLMVTSHLTSEFRTQTNKQKILFTHIYLNTVALQISKHGNAIRSREGKAMVLKIMKMSQHNSTEAVL